MRLTVEGIFTFFNRLHPLNAFTDMFVIDDGTSTVSKLELRLSKANGAIIETVSGIETRESRPRYFLSIVILASANSNSFLIIRAPAPTKTKDARISIFFILSQPTKALSHI